MCFSNPRVLAHAFAMVGLSTVFSHSSAQEIDPVVVVSSRTKEQLSDVLPSVSVIERADIDKARYADLHDLLAGLPGTELARTGGPGNPISVYMRGSNSTQTLVLVDGIPFAAQGAIGASSPLEAIPVSQIERIEILRGNASALYGSGAAGGVIHVFTQGASTAPDRVDARAEVGSLQSQTLQTGFRKKMGSGQLTFSLSDTRSDGISTMTPSRYASIPTAKINPDRNGFDSQSSTLGWRQELSPSTQLTLHHLYTTTLASYDNPYAASVQERWSGRSDLQIFGGQLAHRVNEQWRSTLAWGQSISENKTLTNDVYNADYGKTESQQSQFKWDNVLSIGQATQLSFGYAHQHSRLLINRNGYDSLLAIPIDVNIDRSARSNRLFAGISHVLGPWSWRLNLGHDNLPGGIHANTYLVGMGYQINPLYKFTWTQSSAIQAPTVGQLFDAGFGGNPALRAERSSSQEIGLQFKDEKSFWRTVLFDVDYKDMIALSNNLVSDPFWAKRDVTQLENLNRARNQGIELAYARQWAAWKLQVSMTSQNPENLSSSRPILNRSKHFGSATLSHFLNQSTSLHLRLLATSERRTPKVASTDTALVPGYAIMNLSAQHALRRDLQLRFSVLNALDKNYFHIDGYNNPGRTFYVGLNYFAH